MAERVALATQITQHTLWQALTGTTPPLVLPATPIPSATLDSREVRPGGLFIALPGQQTDGHFYVGQALARGAAAVICEPRGLDYLDGQPAVLVRCRGIPFQRPPLDPGEGDQPLVYVVPDSLAGLQAVGAFQRLHRTHPELRVIGITGSVGKTSTKDLTAAVLAQRYTVHANPGNLNSEQGLPLTLLGLGLEHQRAVLEMGMYALGEIRHLCELARPHVGVVTNVGPSHLERLGTIERIAQAKAELVESLPPAEEGGVAILNWDDERVRAMAQHTQARIFRYGLTPEAELWADEIEGLGLEGIRFRFHHRTGPDREETLYVRIPLLGRHSVHTALRAAAVGLVEGLTWPEIAAGLQRSGGQLRLVAVAGLGGSTIIDDTYNASPSSTLAALNLLADLRNGHFRRRIAVLGDMRELGSYTEEGHRLVGVRAADVVDLLVTVGELARIIGQEARAAGLADDRVREFSSAEEAIHFLEQTIGPEDLVLVKGSRAVGMDRIVAAISV